MDIKKTNKYYLIIAIIILANMTFVFGAIDDTTNAQIESPPSGNYFYDNLSLFLVVFFGIFAVGAYTVVTFFAMRANGTFGPWIILALACTIIVFAEIFSAFTLLHRRMMAAAMFLMFFAALFRYWNAVEVGQ